MKRAALQLTLPCAPQPTLSQTRSSDMDHNISFLVLEEKARLARAAKAEVRARPAGGTSAPGGGGGGGGVVSGSAVDAVRQVGVVGAGAAGSPLVFPAPMARRTRPRWRAPRSLDDRDRRRTVSATRGLQRYNN